MDSGKKNSVLIVDDEKANLRILNHILGPEYTISMASNGSNAIEIARKYAPDLILLDIIMPGMDGYQVLMELRKYEETSKIPIIFITGLNSPEDEEKGLALDAADYIAKPFSPMIVKLRVRNQIQLINQLRTIEHLGFVDPLTNLPNRRSFDTRLCMEWKQAIREKTPISILIMDIDKFKDLNDTYGHQQGDSVLQAIAGIFMHSLKRPGDFAARWGGEEFIVLLPNTPLAGAMDIAEKIRSCVQETEVPLKDGTILKLTISIGVNSDTPECGCSFESFISCADKALYSAKQAGRNRVQSFQENI